MSSSLVRLPPTEDLISKKPTESVIIQEKITSSNGRAMYREYRKGRFLGKGGFASCYEVRELQTNQVFACKIIAKSSMTKPKQKEKLLSEIAIHKSLKHENIVQFERVFEDNHSVYIVLELCNNQSMSDLLKRCKKLPESEARFYLKQIVSAVEYMHNRLVIHRDLKLGNIFLNNNQVKIGDFGLASQLQCDDERRRTICGTPNYLAPEVLNGNHSFEVDIWAVGVILFTLLVGTPPFETDDVKATYQRIKDNSYHFPPETPISTVAKDLIQRLLAPNPQHRPTISVVPMHAWFNVAAGSPPKNASGQRRSALLETTNLKRQTEDAAPSEHKAKVLCTRDQPPPQSLPLPPVTKLDFKFESKTEPFIPPKVEPKVEANGVLPKTEPKLDVKAEMNFVPPKIEPKLESKFFGLPKPDPKLDVKADETKPEFVKAGEAKENPPIASTKVKTLFQPQASSSRNNSLRDIFYNDPQSATQSQQPTTAPPNLNPNPTTFKAPLKPLSVPPLPASISAPKTSAKPVLDPPSSDLNPIPMSSGIPIIPPPQTNPVISQSLPVTIPPLQINPVISQAQPPNSLQGKNETKPKILQTIQRTLTESFMQADTEQAASIPPNITLSTTPIASPSLMVSKYLDMSNRYGLTYMLNDGTIGAHFNDLSVMLWVPHRRVLEYYPLSGKSEKQSFTVDTFPETLKKKVSLIKYFSNRLNEIEEDNIRINPSLSLYTQSSVYVLKWAMTKEAILFRFSDERVQVSFFDKTKLILSSEAQVVTFVNTKNEESMHTLVVVMRDAQHHEIRTRLRYTKDILTCLTKKA